MAKLAAAQLPIGQTHAFTASDDPNSLLGRPGQYIAKASFNDQRLEVLGKPFDVDNGGSIELFGSDADAVRRRDYVTAFAKSPLFAEYDFLLGRRLLRVSHRLTPDQAEAYRAALA